MIIQEINLYQERFKEKKIWLSAAQILMLSGLTVAILVFASYQYNDQLMMAESQNFELLDKKEQSTQVLQEHRDKLQAMLADNQFDSQISKISADIAVRKRIVDFVSNNQFGSGQGFSSYLSGLSEIKIKSVWLNEITLAEDYLKMAGSALKAEKIPEYFNQFKQSQLFGGKDFEVFQLDRVPDQDWKVDFLIASRVAKDEE